jgi:hypothetical protein
MGIPTIRAWAHWADIRVGQGNQGCAGVARDVLGLLQLHAFGRLAFFDCGGMWLSLAQEAPKPRAESILHLLPADIRAAHNELTARGIDFTCASHIVHKDPGLRAIWWRFCKAPADGRRQSGAEVQPEMRARSVQLRAIGVDASSSGSRSRT